MVETWSSGKLSEGVSVWDSEPGRSKSDCDVGNLMCRAPSPDPSGAGFPPERTGRVSGGNTRKKGPKPSRGASDPLPLSGIFGKHLRGCFEDPTPDPPRNRPIYSKYMQGRPGPLDPCMMRPGPIHTTHEIDRLRPGHLNPFARRVPGTPAKSRKVRPRAPDVLTLQLIAPRAPPPKPVKHALAPQTS